MGTGRVELHQQAVHGVVEEWAPEHPGCWRLTAHPQTPLGRLAAAVRRAGPGAVVDRYTSLALRRLVSAFPTRPRLLLPHASRLRRLDGLDVRRTRHLDDVDIDEVEGIPTIALRVGIECQGYRDHTGASALDRDAARSNQLVGEADGVTLQPTPTMLHEGWPALLTDLCACLRRRASALRVPTPAGADLR